MVPQTTVPIGDAGEARRVLRLVDALEDNDDVQDVWTNADIDAELLQSLDA